MTNLTVLCVTRNQPYARSFIERMATDANWLNARLVVALDVCRPERWMTALDVVRVQSRGYIESVLDGVIGDLPDGYVLRLDDDEQMGPAMLAWLALREYEAADHWAFPRAHLYPDENQYIVNAPLWPDLQTRLSVKAKAGGRSEIHVGSPFGTGRVAPCHIEHHKFLVRDRKEREALVAHYDAIREGAGSGFEVFSVPERFEEHLVFGELGEKVAA